MILLSSFCRKFMSRLCHGSTSENSRVIDGRSIQILSTVILQLSSFRGKRIHVIVSNRSFLISPMIVRGFVKDSLYTCKFLRFSNSRIINLRNLYKCVDNCYLYDKVDRVNDVYSENRIVLNFICKKSRNVDSFRKNFRSTKIFV